MSDCGKQDAHSPVPTVGGGSTGGAQAGGGGVQKRRQGGGGGEPGGQHGGERRGGCGGGARLGERRRGGPASLPCLPKAHPHTSGGHRGGRHAEEAVGQGAHKDKGPVFVFIKGTTW